MNITQTLVPNSLFKKLQPIAQQNNLNIVDVRGDGSCFFYALYRQLVLAGLQCPNLTVETGGIYIRHLLLEYLMKDEQEVYRTRYNDIYPKKSFDAYLQKFMNTREWAEEFHIQATAEMLKITIIILKEDGNIIPINGGCEVITITIGHIAEIHYVGFDKIQSRLSQTILIKQIEHHTDNKSNKQLEPIKRTPMTPAERQRASRAKRAAEKIQVQKGNENEKSQPLKRAMTDAERKRASRNKIAAETKKLEEIKNQKLFQKRVRMANNRELESPEERSQSQYKACVRMAKNRKLESPEERV